MFTDSGTKQITSEIPGDMLSSSISSILSSAEGETESKIHLNTSEYEHADTPSCNLLSFQTLGSDAAGNENGFKDKVDVEDGSSGEFNESFCSHLYLPASSSDANTPTPILIPKRSIPSQDTNDTPASPKQPRLRTPDPLNDSVALAKKHLSQPSDVHDAVHGRTRRAISMLHPIESQGSDLKQEIETMEDMMPFKGMSETPPSDTDSFVPMSVNKPPTPPLHRCPSWVGVNVIT